MLKSALRGSATFHLSVFQYPLHITNTAIIRSYHLSILLAVERLETAVLGHAVAFGGVKGNLWRSLARAYLGIVGKAELSYCVSEPGLIWELE